MSPELFEAHDRLEATHWWFRGRRRIIAEVLRRQLTHCNSRRILDVGCGTGGMLPLLAQFGEVQGAEASTDALERARKKFPHIPIGPCDLPEQLPAGEFDLITLFDVLEHLDHPVQSLEALARHLGPGGQLVVTVPAFQFLWSRHDDLNQHRLRYSQKQLRAHLSSAGLMVSYVSYFNTLLFPAVAVTRAVERLVPSLVPEAGDLDQVGEPFNTLLTTLFGGESLALRFGRLPVGVSLIAVASLGRS